MLSKQLRKAAETIDQFELEPIGFGQKISIDGVYIQLDYEAFKRIQPFFKYATVKPFDEEKEQIQFMVDEGVMVMALRSIDPI